MRIKKISISAKGVKFVRRIDGIEVGRAYLYILKNDLHEEPFGFMEDVFVDEALRGGGIGEALVERVIKEARKRGCYKLIATSRHERIKVHALYRRLGFKDHGHEFRIDLI